MERYAELKKQGCNIQRLDTAASGMSAEAGEFMEIVKKLKFQGKPYDAKNKEHLTKELGDIMWYVAQACLALGVRFDEVIYTNTLKLAARYPNQMFETNYSENRQAWGHLSYIIQKILNKKQVGDKRDTLTNVNGMMVSIL